MSHRDPYYTPDPPTEKKEESLQAFCLSKSPCGQVCERFIDHPNQCYGGVPRRYWTAEPKHQLPTEESLMSNQFDGVDLKRREIPTIDPNGEIERAVEGIDLIDLTLQEMLKGAERLSAGATARDMETLAAAVTELRTQVATIRNGLAPLAGLPTTSTPG